ncbi:MAG: tRNA (adenosine(37)-N6)-threonylcarbamoyltransferase complex ATPase subunit type 1 TsaE [Treponema sp.]|nr:tRNA (adenosine(37)-N6)-threonylcarbamoyltransferase complex ATPase subunit type 1 TsaE [Treponema sp.]
MLEIFSNSPDETIALGKKISSYLESGSVVALSGTLGSGKTCLTKGIALGLGISDNLTSPTYTIINEYPLEISALYHIDAYRLNSENDFNDIGGLEVINSGGISVIEWSERISKTLPENTIYVSLEITGSESRKIQIKGMDSL